jgi:Sulfotransferase family
MTAQPGGEAPRSAAAARPKVIYVMGAGRSGSTILGVALGNCAHVFFAGELDHWLVRAGRPSSRRAETERFWGAILQDMGDQAALFGGATTSLERSSALLDVRRWPRRRLLRARYRQASERLYRTIACATGATHIVDTSHYPLRAREMRALEGIEVFLVYLVRDGRSVVASLGRRDVRERTFGPLTANAYLWLTHALSTLVFLSHPRRRRLLVRYEELVRNPELVLGAVLRQCECDAAPPRLAELRTGVPFHGNRLIEADSVALERSPAPVPARGPSLTALLQLPWKAVAWRLRPVANGR